MNYRVELTTAAARQVRRLEPSIRRRVLTVLTNLEADPRPGGVKKLAGLDSAWRIRVGDHRVLYEIEDDVVLVTVFRVGHRRDIYDG